MTPLLLALLAILDAGFAGFRAAAGRNARIFKRDYYTRRALRGALAGAALVLALGAMTLMVLAASPDPARRYAELVVVGGRMLWVFVPYAGLVLGALGLYLVSDHDLRAFATVAILGPFTLLRPWVILAAMLCGLWATDRAVNWFVTTIASGAVVLLGRELDRRARLVPP